MIRRHLLSSTLLLSGCLGGLTAQSHDRSYFHLAPEIPTVTATTTHRKESIIVREATASGFISNQRIIFGDSPLNRQYYQFASWTEPPQTRVTESLFTALQATGNFASVASSGSSALTDFTLVTKILEFYHDTQTSPGKAIIELRMEEIDNRTGAIRRSRNFREETPSETFDVEGAVLAFDRGLQKILSDAVAWLSE